MNRFVLILVCFLALASTVHSATISDDFNRADSLDLGTNWDSGYSGVQACQVFNNTAQAQASGDVCVESWNANTFGADQWAQITVNFNALSGNTARLGPLLRVAAPSAQTFYRVKARWNDAATTRLDKVIASANTILATESSTIWVSGDVLYFEIVGTSLTVKRNGAVLLTATDPDLASGRIGIEINEESNPNSTWGDDFSGGDLAAAGARRRTGPMAFQ